MAMIRAFAAFADKRNIAEAGTALNVSHAAISQQMRALEVHLGVRLFDRSGRRLRLTPDGEALAREVLAGFEAMAQAFAALTDREAQRPLEVTTTPAFASGWLMPRLARFRALHPAIDIRLDPSAEIRPLAAGGTDIALRYGDGHWPGLQATHLVTSPIVVVAAPSLVADAQFAHPSDLSALPWLQELGTNEVSDWLAQHGVARAAGSGLTTLPGHLMLEAARQGQGIATYAKIFVADDIAAGRLRLLFEDSAVKGYHAVVRPGVLRPPLKAFLAWIQKEAVKT